MHSRLPHRPHLATLAFIARTRAYLAAREETRARFRALGIVAPSGASFTTWARSVAALAAGETDETDETSPTIPAPAFRAMGGVQ